MPANILTVRHPPIRLGRRHCRRGVQCVITAWPPCACCNTIHPILMHECDAHSIAFHLAVRAAREGKSMRQQPACTPAVAASEWPAVAAWRPSASANTGVADRRPPLVPRMNGRRRIGTAPQLSSIAIPATALREPCVAWVLLIDGDESRH